MVVSELRRASMRRFFSVAFVALVIGDGCAAPSATDGPVVSAAAATPASDLDEEARDAWKDGVEAGSDGDWQAAAGHFERVVTFVTAPVEAADVGLAAASAAEIEAKTAEGAVAAVSPDLVVPDSGVESSTGSLAETRELSGAEAAIVSAALVNLGIAYERQGEAGAALDAFERAFSRGESNDASQLLVAPHLMRSLLAVGELKRAREVVARALEIAPADVNLLIASAGIHRRLKDWDRAIDVARRALRRGENKALVFKAFAQVYADQGKLLLAESFYRNALELNKDDASIYVNLGLLASQRGKRQLAIAEFEKALEMEPGNTAALVNIGAISLHFRDYQRASGSYRAAIDAGRKNCSTVSALGYAYEGEQRGDEAVAELREALGLCDGDAPLHFAIGNICMMQLRDNDCALSSFKQFVGLSPRVAPEHVVHQFIAQIEDEIAAMTATPDEVEGDAANGEDVLAEDSEATTVGEAGEGVGGDEAAEDVVEREDTGSSEEQQTSKGM